MAYALLHHATFVEELVDIVVAQLPVAANIPGVVADELVGALFEVIEVINFIVDFTVPPHQIRRVWRHQSLHITAQLGEARDYPTGGFGFGWGVSAGRAGV